MTGRERICSGANENILANLTINGQTRNVTVQFNRNGFAYTVDRAIGEMLVAKPFSYENWASGIDLTTKMPVIVNAEETQLPALDQEHLHGLQ